MKAGEIYDAYRIMPNLRDHQLRVASVAQLIAENASGIDARTVVLAALFHDMGNILKFELSYFPEFVEREGRAYWEGVKEEYRSKYGADHHAASVAIAREIGLPERVVHIISGVTFTNLIDIRDSADMEQKVVDYADMRVGPHGVLSLQERLGEAHQRYLTTHPDEALRGAEYEGLATAAIDIEKQLFAICAIHPEDITGGSIGPLMERLAEYQVT